MAYILGFFAADGAITIGKRNNCYFDITIADRALLYSIRKAMGSTHKISVKFPKLSSHSKLYRLQIGSREIVEDLISLGFTAQKTFNMSVPNIPDNFFGSFVRGYFEGDGHVWLGLVHKRRRKPCITIQTCFTSVSEKFLVFLRQRLVERSIKGGLRCRKGAFCLYYSVRGSMGLYSLMYEGYKESLQLARKRSVFEKYKKCAHSLAG